MRCGGRGLGRRILSSGSPAAARSRRRPGARACPRRAPGFPGARRRRAKHRRLGAERVVHQREAVEVDAEQRKLGAAARRGEDRLARPVGEQRGVRQPCQRVARGELLDARLGVLARGDVGAGAAPAGELALGVAHRHPAHRQPDHAARLGDHPVQQVAERLASAPRPANHASTAFGSPSGMKSAACARAARRADSRAPPRRAPRGRCSATARRSPRRTRPKPRPRRGSAARARRARLRRACSSMSATVPDTYLARPPACSVTRPRACSHFHSPLRVRMRNSVSKIGHLALQRAHQRLGVADTVVGMHHRDELGAERDRGEVVWPRKRTQPSPAESSLRSAS